MRVTLQTAGASIALGLLAAAAPQPGAEEPSLQPVLELAGRYVARCREKLALVRASERFEQLATFRNDPSPDRRLRNEDAGKASRVLLSDVLWVPSDDDVALAFYRDVWSVDGKPVRDRAERLLALFPQGASATGHVRGFEILNESARFNLGSARWNTNFPTLALAFLDARNRGRFEFRSKGPASLSGKLAVELEYREVGRPTLTRSRDGKDFEARGSLWIAVDDGALLKSDVRYDSLPARIRVSFRHEPALEVFVPVELRESYGASHNLQEIQGVARYSDYRRGDAEIGPIRYQAK